MSFISVKITYHEIKSKEVRRRIGLGRVINSDRDQMKNPLEVIFRDGIMVLQGITSIKHEMKGLSNI